MEKLKRYLLPSALILALGLAYATAQSITKAIQLSQDSTGAFGVDTNNNVYFPGHILSTGPGTPVLTSCGTGSPAVVGTDTAGQITLGTSATACTLTFAQAYVATPWCVVTVQSGVSQIGYTPSTTTLVLSQLSTSGDKVNYMCSGSK